VQIVNVFCIGGAEAAAGVGEAKRDAIIAKRSKLAIFFTDFSLFPRNWPP
jgi:hypothetical protein